MVGTSWFRYAVVAATFMACNGGGSGAKPGAGGSGGAAGQPGLGGSAGGSTAGSGGAAPGGGAGGAGDSGAGAGGSGAAGAGGRDAAGDVAPAADAAAGRDVAVAGDVGGASPGSSQACRDMVEAASAFAASIQGEAAKRTEALLPFAMRRWFKFTPGDRPGLPLRSMTAEQQMRALALVRTGLSADGLTKAEGIRALERILASQGGGTTRDPNGYFLAIFGTPATDGDWAWHWEGHHLSLHYTMSKCAAVASVPSFFGTNPRQVGTSVQGAPPQGTRLLGAEEDLARELATLLNMDPQKRAAAIVPGRSRDTADSPATATPRMPAGLAASAMSMAEQEKLKELVTTFAATMAPELAMGRLKRINDAGFGGVSFLWSGSLAAGQVHYFQIQGPTFLIEWVTPQNDTNHVHSAWRDFDGDFGEDVIRLHLQQYPH